MSVSYIYTLSNPITEEVRYVGKTNNIKRRLSAHMYKYRNTHKDSWVQSLRINNIIPEICVIDEVSELEWEFWEKHYISLFKSWGFNLTNSSDGGRGISRASKITREKISKNNKGKKAWNKGIRLSEEHKRALRKPHKKFSDEAKKNMADAHKGEKNHWFGKKFSEEHRNKLSKAKIGKYSGEKNPFFGRKYWGKNKHLNIINNEQ